MEDEYTRVGWRGEGGLELQSCSNVVQLHDLNGPGKASLRDVGRGDAVDIPILICIVIWCLWL